MAKTNLFIFITLENFWTILYGNKGENGKKKERFLTEFFFHSSFFLGIIAPIFFKM